MMSLGSSGELTDAGKKSLASAAGLSREAKSALTKLAAWTSDMHLAFRIISIGMIVMLLWAGAFKLTATGAEGLIPWVSNSPLIWWHFKLFGPYIGSDIIGSTEITAALLIIVGHFQPKAGIVGGLVGTLMFFITSTMIISTPGTTILIHGIRYMDLVGLFFFKDVISLGACFYLVSYFGREAILRENKSE